MMKKNLIFIILTLIVLFSSISISVFAEATDDGLVLEKSVTQQADENGNYRITLDAYTTGEVKTQTIPVDVIFVLDTSGSMDEKLKLGEQDREKKINCLKRSVISFLTELNDNAKEQGIVHKVSIVTFDSGAEKITGDSYVEIDGSDSVNAVIEEVNKMDPYGGTNPDKGMVLAEEVFNNNSEKNGNSQALIMFTDGYPNMEGYETTCPDKAIKIAKRLKNQGVNFYSVGVFDKANTEMITFEDTSMTEAKYIDNTHVIANRFMNYFSSNSPNAKDLGVEIYLKEDPDEENAEYYFKMTEPIYDWSNAGYYMIAENADELSAIFNHLSQELITSSISLDNETQVRDYVSEYFKMNDNFSAEDVTLKVIPYVGDKNWGDVIEFAYVATVNGIAEFQSNVKDYRLYVEYDKDVGSIIVHGFDFDENVVAIDSSGNATGNKLQISFDIMREDFFIGGNDVPTNLSSAGIYSKDVVVKTFDVPNTQVELVYDFETENQIIYRGNSIEFDKILYLNTENLGMANAFVDINFHIYDSDGKGIGTVTIPKGSDEVNITESLNNLFEIQDIDYKIECIVTPNTAEEESVAELDSVKSSSIYVLQPKVSGCNLWVDYGTTVNLQKDAMTEVTWSGKIPEGTYYSRKENPPIVNISYGNFETDNIVVQSNLQYNIDKLMITSSDGAYTSEIEMESEVNIYLNEYGVEITKLVVKEVYLKNPQSFLFEIQQNGNIIEIIMPRDAFEEYDDQTLYCTMKVSGLYAGLDAVVSEKPSWSWRYELDNSDEAVTVTYHNNPKMSYVKVSDGEVDVQFKNKLMIPNWLGDEQSVINKFGDN